MDESEPLLLIKDLVIEGRVEDTWSEIVRGVDITLQRGEVLGLIGESGAGKSTIGLAAMGYTRDGCRIAGGSIRFDGVELTTASDAKLRALRGKRIAYVAQSAAASFNPAHQLMQQHVEAPLLHGVSDRRASSTDAIELYRRLRLPDPEGIGFRYPHQVSGGQLQRCMTAMAMSCRPDLIIFDEPTTALDVTTQIEVLAAIRKVVEDFGTAALYITPRPRRSRADGRQGEGAPARRRGRGGRHAHDARLPPKRITRARSGPCAASSASLRPRRKRPRRRSARSTTSRRRTAR